MIGSSVAVMVLAAASTMSWAAMPQWLGIHASMISLVWLRWWSISNVCEVMASGSDRWFDCSLRSEACESVKSMNLEEAEVGKWTRHW